MRILFVLISNLLLSLSLQADNKVKFGTLAKSIVQIKKLKPLHRVQEEIYQTLQTKTQRNDLIPLHNTRKNRKLLIKIKLAFARNKKLIATGGFGKTYTVSLLSGRKTFIVKQMLRDKYSLDKIAKEIAPFHYMGPQKHLINYYGCFRDSNGYWSLVLEKADQDLAQFLEPYLQAAKKYHSQRTQENKAKILSRELAIILTQDLFAGLASLHRKGIAHGDLKYQNVVVIKQAGPKRPIIVKFIDFGSATSTRQKPTDNTYTLGFLIVDEHLLYELLWKAVKNKPRAQILSFSKNDLLREAHALFRRDDARVNQLINKAREYLSAVDKRFRHAKYDNAWQKDQHWQEISYEYIKHYKRTATDLYALGVIFKKIYQIAFLRQENGIAEQLLEPNPLIRFQRPKS